MGNKDLERLLELHHYKTDQEGDGLEQDEEQEHQSLKSKLEEQLEKSERLDDTSHELVKQGEMETLESIIKELEQENKQLKEELAKRKGSQ